MNTCAISVIIPTYRPQAWLFECLDALDRQTLPKERFEVIVALNGPADPYARPRSHELYSDLSDSFPTE